jgi:hypothetical protein
MAASMMEGEGDIERVTATPAAFALIAEFQAEYGQSSSTSPAAVATANCASVITDLA